jgi:hypothetical protein
MSRRHLIVLAAGAPWAVVLTPRAQRTLDRVTTTAYCG